METEKNDSSSKSKVAMVWTGRVLSVLIGLLFLLSGVMKLVGGEQVEVGMGELGLPAELRVPLAILEIACAAVYLIPQTTILGAILLTGYIGGAICSHWRVGDAVYLHVAIGVFIWLPVYLRDARLRSLIPLWLNAKI